MVGRWLDRPTCDQAAARLRRKARGKKFFQAPPPSIPRRWKKRVVAELEKGDQLFSWGRSQLLHGGIRKRLYAVFFLHTSNFNKKSGSLCPQPQKSLPMSPKWKPASAAHAAIAVPTNQPSPASVLSRKCKQRTTLHTLSRILRERVPREHMSGHLDSPFL